MVAGVFVEADAPGVTNQRRGELLENLVRDLFALVDGVTYWKSRVINAAGSAEFDVCFINDERISPVYKMGHVIIVECKNTAAKVTSPTLRTFVNKLQTARSNWGILVAAYGITGSMQRKSAAHDVVLDSRTLQIPVNILVVTRKDLLELDDASDVTKMLIDKIMSHTLALPSF